MENIKNTLLQTPVFNAVIANLKDNEDKINLGNATVDMFDHLFLMTNQKDGLRRLYMLKVYVTIF